MKERLIKILISVTVLSMFVMSVNADPAGRSKKADGECGRSEIVSFDKDCNFGDCKYDKDTATTGNTAEKGNQNGEKKQSGKADVTPSDLSGCKGDKEQKKEQKKNKDNSCKKVIDETGLIGKDAALSAALTAAGTLDGTEENVKVCLDRKDGVTVYEVKFTVGETAYKYEVNALTGEAVVKICDNNGKQLGKKKVNGKKAVDETGLIGKEAALSAALTDAGFTAEQVEKVKTIAEAKNGEVVYKVKFVLENTKYTYEIDSLTAEIIEVKTVECRIAKQPAETEPEVTPTDIIA